MPREQDNPARTDTERLLDALALPAFVLASDHSILRANALAAGYLGAPDPEALRGRRCWEVVHGTDRPPPGCPLALVVETRTSGEADMPVEVAGGRLIRVSCSPLPEPLLGQPAFFHVMTDLTELRDAEARATRHATLQAALASLGLAALSTPSAEVFAERCAEVTAMGLDAGLALVLDLRPGRSPLVVRARAGRLASIPIPDPLDPEPHSLLRRAESSNAPVTSPDLTTDRRFPPEPCLRDAGLQAAAVVPVPGKAGNPTGLLCLADDRPRSTLDEAVPFLRVVAALLGQRRLLDLEMESMRRREALSRAITEQTFDLIAVSDLSWHIQYANQAHERMLGYSPDDLLGESILQFMHPEDVPKAAAQLGAALAKPDPSIRHEETVRLRHADGSYRTLDVVARLLVSAQGTPTDVVFSSRDVTERLQAQAEAERTRERLLHSQRLEALGQFAGTVAHDFNNLITVMQGVASLVKRRLSGDPRVQAELQELDKAARAAATLNQGLLAFARRQPTAPRTFSLVQAVRATRPMLARLCGEDIDLRLRFGGDPCPVRMDPGQVEQILMNLASNARDAQADGGAIQVQVRRLSAEETRCPTCGLRVSGEQVELLFSDSGPGMSPEVRARAFEPFFSTKGPGKGTGLGLASVHGIVLQNGGHIELHSAPGQSTRIRIRLPMAPTSGDEASSERDSSAALAALPIGGETLLLVEDEALVRRLAARSLESVGYRVLQAGDAKEAKAVARAHPGPIHLLVCDVVLPGPSGPALYQRLLAQRPNLPVLYVSGYSRDVLIERADLPPDAELMTKPFRPSELITRVSAALPSAHAPPKTPEPR